MDYTLNEVLEKLAGSTAANRKRIETGLKQRRNQAMDLQGVEYTRQGGSGAPATFYLSISPDMVYMERFEFKLIIQPFVSSSGIGTSVTEVEVEEVDLSITSANKITPNPHTHKILKHSHQLSGGIATTPTTATDFRMAVEGIDITPYLMAQHGWVNGEGVYPALDVNRNYDILEVASDMCAEGKHADADKLVKAGYKRVQIFSEDLFSATLVLYQKYSHMNR